jgi:hypothetical protein
VKPATPWVQIVLCEVDGDGQFHGRLHIHREDNADDNRWLSVMIQNE